MATFNTRDNFITALNRYQGLENGSHEYSRNSEIYKQLDEYFTSRNISTTYDNINPQIIHQALRKIGRSDCYEDTYLILQIFRNT